MKTKCVNISLNEFQMRPIVRRSYLFCLFRVVVTRKMKMLIESILNLFRPHFKLKDFLFHKFIHDRHAMNLFRLVLV